MIRINLLQGPRSRKSKGQSDVRVEAAAGGGLLVLTLGICMYYSGSLSDEIEARQVAIQEKTKQVAALKVQVIKVENFEKKKQQLEKKNQIIDQLEKSRRGPVKVLDGISQSLEPLKLWLVRLNVKGKKVQLEGRALDNDDVVGFVNNLRRGEQFDAIELMETRAKLDKKIKVIEFKLKMALKG